VVGVDRVGGGTAAALAAAGADLVLDDLRELLPT
jgi:phosphoglycolate phosphatase-like HAD superfamily hydrolase